MQLVSGELRAVRRFIAHPGYDGRAPVHDIGLVQLQQPRDHSDAVRSVCLPSRYVGRDWHAAMATVTGYYLLLMRISGIQSTNSCHWFLPCVSLFCAFYPIKDLRYLMRHKLQVLYLSLFFYGVNV